MLLYEVTQHYGGYRGHAYCCVIYTPILPMWNVHVVTGGSGYVQRPYITETMHSYTLPM